MSAVSTTLYIQDSVRRRRLAHRHDVVEMVKCEVCDKAEAVYGVQFVSEPSPTFSLLGHHYRGCKMLKVCDQCRDAYVFSECKCGGIAFSEIDYPASGQCARCENAAIDEALHGDPENALEYLERRVV